MTMSSCAGTHAMAMRQPLSFDGVHNFLDTLFGDDLHAKRVKSLAGATLGGDPVRVAGGRPDRPGSGAGARAADQACGQAGGPAVVQPGHRRRCPAGHRVPYVVGQRDSITVAMDWTEFDADGQATIMLSLLSRHGRATPLVWLTVDKATLKNRRNGYEYQVLVRLAEILPADVRVRIVADRGFGDHKLYRVLSEELNFSTSSSAFAAISRSPPPMARRGPRPIGLAPAVAREPCAVLRSPPRRIRSPPWSACGRRA